LAKKKRVAIADLEDEPVLLLDDGHCFRTQALALCSKAGAQETDLRATSLATLVQMVSSGAGITLLPSLAVSVENRRGQLDIRPLAAPTPKRRIVLAWRKASPLGPALRQIAKAMCEASGKAASRDGA
jgi:LysR family hydrogen peroxide-inducible transcriptional activator